MESWVPLLDIFLNSPSPEIEASIWLQQSFNASSSTNPITTSSFLSLLSKPSDAILLDSPSSSFPPPKRVMWIETLPSAVQSRILSFLLVGRERFCARDLSKLARSILCSSQGLDFWVEKAARNLLDVMSEPNYDWISSLGLDSVEESAEEDFLSLPTCLKDAAGSDELLLPWLPIPVDDLNSRTYFDASGGNSDSLVDDRDNEDDYMYEVQPEINKIVRPENAPLDAEVQKAAASIRARILTIESTSKIISLGNEIHDLCFSSEGDAFAILGLIEPWKVDDETASVLVSHLSNGSEEETGWPSQVLSSIILPKLLVLEQSASRVLLNSTIEYCKLHQRAAVRAVLFPLFLRTEGINNPIADVISRIIRECLHTGHVSAFCQNLLCDDDNGKKFMCLPCHRGLISNELIWTESLFTVFQSILNHNVFLTPDSIDHLVHSIEESAERFSKSLKFGNFLLCFVSKCSFLLKSHKRRLTEVVGNTNTLVTKSILSKLATL